MSSELLLAELEVGSWPLSESLARGPIFRDFKSLVDILSGLQEIFVSSARVLAS